MRGWGFKGWGGGVAVGWSEVLSQSEWWRRPAGRETQKEVRNPTDWRHRELINVRIMKSVERINRWF